MQESDSSPSAQHSQVVLSLLDAEGMLLQLADGTIAACNPAAEQLLGCTVEQIRGWTSNDDPWQTIHEDGTVFSGETHPAMVALRTGQPQLGVVMGLYHPDGTLVWLQIDAQPLFQTASSPYGVLSTFRQVPPSEKAALPDEMALWESQERNELAMEVARMFAFEWDLATDVVKRSAHCGPILGLVGDEIEQDTGANFFRRVHPDDREQFITNLQMLTPASSTYRTTYRMTCSDGAIVILEESARGLFNQQGHLVRLIGMTADVTERKQTEEALRQSQAQLQQQLAEIEAIYQSAPIGLTVLDRNLRFVRINQRLAEINGLPVQAHLGHTVREVLPDIADVAEQRLRPVLEQGEPLFNVEIRGETPAQPGVERIWLEHFLPLKDGNTSDPQAQKVIGVSIVCEEVTERRRSELALREAHIQLEAALAAGAISTWRWNISDDRVITDRFCASLFGLDPAAAGVGLSSDVFLQWLHPDDQAQVAAAIDRSIATGENYEAEYRVCPPQGEERWVIARGRVEYDAQGKAISLLGALADITVAKHREAELKRTEEALRQNAARLEFILFASRFGIWEVDLQSQPYVAYSRSLRHDQIYGYDSFLSEWTYDTFISHIHPDDRAFVEEQFLQTVTTYVDWNVECRIVRADGALRWVWINGGIYRDSAAQPTRLMGLVADITDRKQAEQEREQMLRTEQLLRLEAEKANRIKDEFLAVLSHELRTPLNPILGWAKLLQGGRLPAAKAAEAVTIIERNAKLQSQLIEDLLDVSRILRGKLKLNVGLIDLVTTISAALETVCHAAAAKDIQLDLSLQDVQPLMGDADRLQQVVWNLLTNAVKFTPRGGRVEVRLEQIERNNIPSAQITVTDTGKGISPEFLPYVFEHFRQEDSTTTRQFGGLGLGLAIVRQIVEMHGGTVWADSPGNGQGATFTVTLPLPQQAMATLHQNAASVSIDQSAPLTGIRALVVDDDLDSLEFVAFALEQVGAFAVQTSSAIEGLQILAESRFDVLISDIGMPEMDGYDFLRQVRSKPVAAGGQIPAIALTAYAGEFDRQQAIQAGFQIHLAKPVELEELAKAVVTLLAK